MTRRDSCVESAPMPSDRASLLNRDSTVGHAVSPTRPAHERFSLRSDRGHDDDEPRSATNLTHGATMRLQLQSRLEPSTYPRRSLAFALSIGLLSSFAVGCKPDSKLSPVDPTRAASTRSADEQGN